MADPNQGSEDDMDDQLSPEEMQAIAKHLLCRCPPGEQKAMAKDLKSLVDSEVLTDDMVKSFCAERAMKYFDFAKDTRVVCHPDTMHEAGVFRDPSTGKLHTVDALEMESKEATGGDDFQDSDLRKAVDDALQKYMNDHYEKRDHASNACAVIENGEGKLTCVLSAKNTSLGNYWTGSWRSTYSLENGALSGCIKIQVHYFESGNVQLNTKFENKMDVGQSDDQKTMATNIVKAIKEMENKFQSGLSKFFTDTTSQFKKVRRGLTVQGTMFDWRLNLHENVGMMAN